MSTKIIKSGSSSFTLKTVKPPSWLLSGTITLDIIALNGIVLLADHAVTSYAGDTVKTAAVAGKYVVEMNTGTELDAGARIAIGSTEQGHEFYTVDGFDSDNDTIEIEDGLDEDVGVGADIIGLEMSSVIDVSVDAFEGIKEVTVKWKSDTDDITMSETWRILESYNQADGLVYDFAEAYPSIVDSVRSVENLYERANQWMVEHFNAKERDFRKIVDNQLTKESVMLKMALMVGRGGDVSEEMYVRLKDDFKENMTTLDNLKIWTDTNEDDIQQDEETEPADMYSTVSRGM